MMDTDNRIPVKKVDKNGIGRVRYMAPNAGVTKKLRQDAFTMGDSRRQPSSLGMTAQQTPEPQAPQQGMGQAPQWLVQMVQQYAQGMPIKLSLQKNSPVLEPEMLNPTPEQLQNLDPNMRQALARSFLSLASKYYGDNSLQNTVLVGRSLRGYLPPEIMKYYKYLKGE